MAGRIWMQPGYMNRMGMPLEVHLGRDRWTQRGKISRMCFRTMSTAREGTGREVTSLFDRNTQQDIQCRMSAQLCCTTRSGMVWETTQWMGSTTFTADWVIDTNKRHRTALPCWA